MSAPKQKWLRGLQSSVLFQPPPQNANKKQTEVLAYVELFGQFASDSFVDDVGELVRHHYPSQESCLLDDVLATFILQHPEHGHGVLHALLSCVIDGTLVYKKQNPPFRAFISLFSPSTEREFSELWALACGETLRVLTHYNRPTLRSDAGRPSGNLASPSTNGEGSGKVNQEDFTREDGGRKSPARLLTPWITDSLLAASSAIRNDYFRWCGGVMGRYATGEELRPPSTVGHVGQPQLLPSTPRWALANGAAVILSVCDDEVSRYETADLTASAVPALLIRPPPSTIQNEHSGLPPLEAYSRLFHRYYAIATPGATQRLLFGLLESPTIGANHGLLVAVALLEVLCAADGCNSLVQLSPDWLHLHFLKPLGTAMAMRSGMVADTAAALLFHIFAKPSIFVPPPSRCHGVSATQSLYGCATFSSGIQEGRGAAPQTSEDNTAAGLAALMTGHGEEVEQQICTLWEAALGLRPLNRNVVNLPESVLSTPLQPPSLSWNLMRSLLRILDYLPTKSVSWDCLRRIFTATVEAILQRTFPCEETKTDNNLQALHAGIGTKVAGMAELRAMVHCLFTESFLCTELAAQLLSDALTLCLSHDAKRQIELRDGQCRSTHPLEGHQPASKELQRPTSDEAAKNRGAVATFDSYVVAAVCALACEVRLLSFSPSDCAVSKPTLESNGHVDSIGLQISNGQRYMRMSPNRLSIDVATVVEHTKRLGLLELLLARSPYFDAERRMGEISSTNEVLRGSSVAAHMSCLLGKSRACLHSLTEIMKCKWDPGICSKAAAVLVLVNKNGGLSSAANLERGFYGRTDSALMQNTSGVSSVIAGQPDNRLQLSPPCRLRGTGLVNVQKQKSLSIDPIGHVGNRAYLPLEAADVAALLCKDWQNGQNDVSTPLRCVIEQNQHLAVAAASLLFQRLISAPEMPNVTDGTPSEYGWCQVIEALCRMAVAFPGSVIPVIVAQAETQLQPWIGKDDMQNQKSDCKVNTRIVTLLLGLLGFQNNPYVVKSVVQDGTLLRRATDGLTINGEACILPQLKLLEAVAVAAQAALKWHEPEEDTADKLFSILRDRLPATVRCLSHSSVHVRALSVARLKDMIYFQSFRYRQSGELFEKYYETEDEDAGNWRKSVEQCVVWELHYRRAYGMPISLLANAATALGCSIPS